ncbi:hypothetical protein LTR41_011342 [Exophiala xenobiotica]|nr:hypothetical protein LTR41_011342 [Exophiala xenobiotica]KAK5243088.1 hypothetical protein LTS06_011069 [Exophiala xenobiotica]KAK5260080.1 hypothetical protein LTR40_004794 [Exophiala xenobiotica]KAK5355208.1 hypothetical protein LTR11_011741 [Exophiala xenobiotica]KAK5550836.1 hypothetical protein LTR46_011164 [Exophiala xenobiotica]
MARRDSVTAQKTRSQFLKLPHQGHLSASFFSTRLTSKVKRAEGIKKGRKQGPLRRSARLDRLIEVHETQQTPVSSLYHLLSATPKAIMSAASVVLRWMTDPIQRAHPPPTLLPSKPPKRKRATEQQLKKPPRTSCPGPSVQDIDSVTYWTQTYHWPREYFNESGEISHLLARKKSTTSLRRKRSDSESGAPSSTTPSDQKPREEKSAPYQDPRYRSLLEAKGSFMGKYVGRNEEGPTAESKKEYKSLLEAEQVVAEHSLFQNDFFEDTCEMIQDRNEAKVIQDIARLIVPSAQSLAVRGAKHLRCLIESVNEGWNNSIPVTKTRPQPDYSVGFKRSAFTDDQLQKLQPFVGDLTDKSFFMGTWYMYFPFFSSEAKCGAAALDVADRQNAHSMTAAVRGVVELFRLVKREQELHREILAFSISHDHRPPISEDLWPLRCDRGQKDHVLPSSHSVYDIWMPAHLKKLCSAIDAIPPDIHFELSEEPDLQFPASSGLSQGLESHHLSDSGATGDDELRLLDPQEVTPETSVTQTSEQATFKKPKKR